MNPLNYATLEASKRLVDAGIVLETDCVWDEFWRIELKYARQEKKTPAPSMAEVWRELPSMDLGVYKIDDRISIYSGFGEGYTENTNPTDALIDLLIWVRKERT